MPKGLYDRGSRITVAGRAARIEAVQSLEDFLVRWEDTGAIGSIPRDRIDLKAVSKRTVRAPETIDSVALRRAEDLYEACKPLLTGAKRTAAMVKAIAANISVTPRTVYRMIARFENSGGRRTALLRPKNDGGRGNKRLDPKIEAIIEAVIDQVYLKERRPTATKAYEELALRCRNAGLKRPHINTLRNRIKGVTAWDRTRRRYGERVAREKMSLLKGETPGADRPLAMVQIDHHLCDAEIVDPVHRLPIGRPWLTVAIDVYSRMVAGIFLSMDSPSSSSVGMCMINAMLAKEPYLAELGIEGEWPVWGKPAILHCDNGKDFRGEMLAEACRDHGISGHFRPVRTPHFGGHIERYIGTIAGWFKELPGATFSNPKERGETGRGGRPSLTLRELEKILVSRIVKLYHAKKHASIQTSPLERWKGYFFGPKGQKAELPAPIQDVRRLRLTFMPMTTRTVQRYGIRLEHINYMSDALRPLIPAPDQESPKVRVRYDPRDMSRIHIFDPAIEDYLEVPYDDITRPAATLWEIRQAAKLIKEQHKPADEDAIFRAIEEIRKIEEDAAAKTKKARRNQVRRSEAQERPRLPKPSAPPKESRAQPVPANEPDDASPDSNVIKLPDRPFKKFPVKF